MFGLQPYLIVLLEDCFRFEWVICCVIDGGGGLGVLLMHEIDM